MTRRARAALLALALPFGCRAEHPADAVVLAAASLVGPFTELAAAHERAHLTEIEVFPA